MPTLDVSELNIIASVLGVFTILFGLIAVQIKNRWYLGEALPAVIIGIILGPIATKVLDSQQWVLTTIIRQDDVTLGVMRVMIGIQLVIAGYQLPARYLQVRYREMLVCLLPIMTIMWLSTSVCVLVTIPHLGLYSNLIIGACVTSTDPILSQAVAKGPFADKFVVRPLREIISAEAGANDGFASPFLGLAINLLLQAQYPASSQEGSITRAFGDWVVETLLYTVVLAIVYGAVAGYCARKAVELSLSRKWIDTESYLLFPCALGLFVLGTCGAIGTSDLLACFIAGCALNWDGRFLAETKRRHDEVNSCIDVLLNFAGFMYIGVTVPWQSFDQPETTGTTWPRLLALGFLVLAFRRIPALLTCYWMMPNVVRDWKEAVFMGYFGPIGVGAIYYLEHTTILLLGVANPSTSVKTLLSAMGPVVYFLALFSIIVHGLSIPVLNCIYCFFDVCPITDDAEPMRRRSVHAATPNNAVAGDDGSFIAFNRFTRPNYQSETLPTVEPRREVPPKPQFSSVIFEVEEEKDKEDGTLQKPKGCMVTCNDV
ncbi:Na(+)/H(+) antiporter [Apiospora arundinis]|uniref:Na(+)/H(+) antiporter n=1 Tax=Apiospora arundinis TaxID=335852 RepID=A0ABR2IXJ6_9PEZI